MKNAKVAKMIVKGVASIVFSAAIGYTYKAGKKIDARIDQHFAEATPEPESEQNN